MLEKGKYSFIAMSGENAMEKLPCHLSFQRMDFIYTNIKIYAICAILRYIFCEEILITRLSIRSRVSSCATKLAWVR